MYLITEEPVAAQADTVSNHCFTMQDISETILTKAAKGDIEAFEVIYRAAAPFVYNVAYRIVASRQEAEEITQEVFLKAYDGLKDFRLESSFSTWVYRIAVNCAINRSKKIARENDKKMRYYKYENPSQAFADARTETEDRDDRDMVDLFLKALHPDQRICIVLRGIEGLSYRQIADILKININTVRTRIKRAREKLIAMRKEVIKDEV